MGSIISYFENCLKKSKNKKNGEIEQPPKIDTSTLVRSTSRLKDYLRDPKMDTVEENPENLFEEIEIKPTEVAPEVYIEVNTEIPTNTKSSISNLSL